LGAASKGAPKSSDGRLVVIKSFGVVFPNNEHAPIVRDLDTQQKIDELAKTPITVKEGLEYQFQVEFFVQNEIVHALKFVNTITKAIFSDKSTHVMGSYAPRVEVYNYKSPTQVAPSGMLARGKYSYVKKLQHVTTLAVCVAVTKLFVVFLHLLFRFSAQTKFIDDDKKQHLLLNYSIRTFV